jgi:hypothetical protein
MSHKPSERIPEDLQQALKEIIDRFELDERPVRERQIRLWKKLEYYWAGFTRVWWDDVAHDWRIFDDGYGYEDNQAGYYDKPINVFRAYLESIIAALSTTVPKVRCYPDDADNTLDVLTARGGTKISELIYRHNDAPLLWAKALFTYCTQGMIAAYNWTHTSEDFGKVPVNNFEDHEFEFSVKYCPYCGMNLSEADIEAEMQMRRMEGDEFDPGQEDAELHFLQNEGQIICPQCQQQIDPELRTEKFIVPRLVGVTEQAKSRQIIEIYGGLYVKVPNWARTQADCPYLGYSYETHFTNVLKKYPDLRDKLGPDSGDIGDAGGNEAYERWGRLSPQYYGEYPKGTPTVRNWWLRPHAFEVVSDEKARKELYKRFPDGVRCVWINEDFAEAENESLDDHWTLTYNPLSEHVHFDPLGLLLTSIQEITQDLVSLTLQTIEHGIPQVFADPSVLNFDQYRNTEVIPGGVYPAKPKSGKSLSEGFYMVSTATLSQEVQPFSQQIQSLGQFVSGALPSLWGGEQSGSSRTAAQYSMSRNQSMQRLQTTWKMINFWWKRVFGKVIPAYIKTMLDDERIVKENNGTFINELIKKSELSGKIGDIELDSSEQLPATIGQIRESVMQLLELNNPQILDSLFSAENLPLMQTALGLDDLRIPGQGDREKQYEEIELLLQSEPMPSIDPMTGMPTEMPSVMPEFEVDNHRVEGDICRSWLVSSLGRQAKTDNPAGYKNVLLHLKMHIQMNQQLSAPQAPPPMPPGEGKPEDKKLRPVNANA